MYKAYHIFVQSLEISVEMYIKISPDFVFDCTSYDIAFKNYTLSLVLNLN